MPVMDSNCRDRTPLPLSTRIIRPLNRENVYSYYMPLNGSLSYYAFSLHCSLPAGGLVRIFPNHGLRLINCLLFNSHLGFGLYLYMSPHLRPINIYHRIMFSAFGSVIFNFGSILFLATTKSLLPNSDWLRIVFSLITSYGFLTIAKEYVEYVNKLI